MKSVPYCEPWQHQLQRLPSSPLRALGGKARKQPIIETINSIRAGPPLSAMQLAGANQARIEPEMRIQLTLVYFTRPLRIRLASMTLAGPARPQRKAAAR